MIGEPSATPWPVPRSMKTLREYGSAASYSTSAGCDCTVRAGRSSSSARRRVFSCASCSVRVARSATAAMRACAAFSAASAVLSPPR